MLSSILAKIGIFTIASSVIVAPVVLHQSFVAPPANSTNLEDEEDKKENCFIIPAESTFDSTNTQLLVCLGDITEEYYLFDSDEGEEFLKIARMQFNPVDKQITVKLESEGEDGGLTESLWSATFVSTGDGWNFVSKEPMDLLDVCTLFIKMEGEETSSPNLLACGENMWTLASENPRGIPLLPFKEKIKTLRN